MMRAAAMRKRAFGYTSISDGERRAKEALRSLKSAIDAVKKAHDASLTAMENMATLEFQGNGSDLSDNDRSYIIDIDGWAKDFSEEIAQNLHHFNNISDIMEDAAGDGEYLL
jgi:hypothetical protein